MWQRHLRFGFHTLSLSVLKADDWVYLSRNSSETYYTRNFVPLLKTIPPRLTSTKAEGMNLRRHIPTTAVVGAPSPPTAMAESLEVSVRSALMRAGYLLVRVPNSIAGIWVSDLWRCMMSTSLFFSFFFFLISALLDTFSPHCSSNSASEAGSEHRLPCSKWCPFPFLRKTLLILTGPLPNGGLQYQAAFQNITCHVI